MTDSRMVLRSVVTYAAVIFLALVLGYLLGNPLDYGTMAVVGTVFLVLCTPLFIRFHYPFMLLAWNMGAYVFFLPGNMGLWIIAIAISFAVSFTHKILDKNVRFLSVPEIARPLIFFAVVIVFTAELRGGFGLRSFGGEAVGGKRYVWMLMGIVGYFALTARQIPKSSVARYIGLFYLSGVVTAVSVLYGVLPDAFNFIFLFIPPSISVESFGIPDTIASMGALRPFAAAGGAVYTYLLARYGIRHMLTPGRRHLFVLFLIVSILTLLSGSRLALVGMLLTFSIQFWLEGLFRTKASVFLALLAVLGGTLAIVFASSLPLSIQRALAVLPVKVDPIAREHAAGSSEWRIQMWQAALPEIPNYLLLGKGFAISWEDYGYMMADRTFANTSVETRGSFIAGDYHSGPISTILPFGMWGVIALTWLLVAGHRVLVRNYRYGDPDLRSINTYLLTTYWVGIIIFVFVFGSIQSDLVSFAGVIGFSVALNGGVASPPVLQRPVFPAAKPRKPEVPRRIGSPEPGPTSA